MSRKIRKRIGETLVEAGLIDGFQLRSALADQKRWGNRLGKTLVKLGFVEEAALMRHLSRVMGLPVAELGGRAIDREVIALVPADQAQKLRCLPLFVDGLGASRYLYVGMEEPGDLDRLDALQMATGLTVCPVLIGFGELDAGLRRHYGIHAEGERGSDEDEAGSDIGSDARVGPDCLRHGDEALASDVRSAPAPAAKAEASRAPAAKAAAEAPRAPAAAPASAAADKDDKPGEIPTRQILQALTQVLIEKGVLTREELLSQVRSLKRR
jgi:hypothetical protein